MLGKLRMKGAGSSGESVVRLSKSKIRWLGTYGTWLLPRFLW